MPITFVLSAAAQLERHPRQRTELAVCWPPHLPPHEAELDVSRARPTRESGTAVMRARRVLVIEDNADLRVTTVQLLELAGHFVVAAADGETGLTLAEQQSSEVAIVDIDLPGIDGYEVARRLRRASFSRHIRLLAVTAYDGPEHRRRALGAGFDEHFSKPMDPASLEQALWK